MLVLSKVKQRKRLFSKILLVYETVSIENSRRNLFIGRIVDRFIFKYKKVTLFSCLTS